MSTIPRAISFFNEKQAQILMLDRLYLSQNAIAKQLNRSRAVVRNFLQDPLGYNTKKRSEAPPKVSETAKRNLIGQASKGEWSGNELCTRLNLDLSACRVQQIVLDAPHLQYVKMKFSPILTARHKQDRVS